MTWAPEDERGTPRLRLIPANEALLAADAEGRAVLERALTFEVPEEWRAGWVREGGEYVVLRATEAGGRPLLIGAAMDGDVTVLEEFRGCGFEAEAAEAS